MQAVRSRPRPAKSGPLAAAAFLSAAFSFLLPGCARPGPRPPETLVSKDGAYIVVIHEGVEAEEAKPVLAALEAQAPRIKADLGVSDPVPYSVHLRGSVGEYLEVMRGLIGGVFPGSTGYAAGRHRAEILLTPLAAQDAVHEYAHSVSLAWARNWHNKPRWLWEAVALYEAGELVDPRSLPYLSEGKFPSLAGSTRTTTRATIESTRWAISFSISSARAGGWRRSRSLSARRATSRESSASRRRTSSATGPPSSGRSTSSLRWGRGSGKPGFPP